MEICWYLSRFPLNFWVRCYIVSVMEYFLHHQKRTSKQTKIYRRWCICVCYFNVSDGFSTTIRSDLYVLPTLHHRVHEMLCYYIWRTEFTNIVKFLLIKLITRIIVQNFSTKIATKIPVDNKCAMMSCLTSHIHSYRSRFCYIQIYILDEKGTEMSFGGLRLMANDDDFQLIYLFACYLHLFIFLSTLSAFIGLVAIVELCRYE